MRIEYKCDSGPFFKWIVVCACVFVCVRKGHQSTGSSAGSGADPSSSELSADTVIYIGPGDEATDCEHPPVFMSTLSSVDSRIMVLGKAAIQRGSGMEKHSQHQQNGDGSPSKFSSGGNKKQLLSSTLKNSGNNLFRLNFSCHFYCPFPTDQHRYSISFYFRIKW